MRFNLLYCTKGSIEPNPFRTFKRLLCYHSEIVEVLAWADEKELFYTLNCELSHTTLGRCWVYSMDMDDAEACLLRLAYPWMHVGPFVSIEDFTKDATY